MVEFIDYMILHFICHWIALATPQLAISQLIIIGDRQFAHNFIPAKIARFSLINALILEFILEILHFL